jgi:hypothetical protein
MHRTTIMLPDTLKKRAEERARLMKISLGEFLREAAEKMLQQEERKWLDDPLASNAFVVAEPGPSDVSENVDRYLYGKHK